MFRLFTLLFVCCVSMPLLAQPIYGVWENQNTNTYYFASMDATTAVKTNVAAITGMTGIIAPNNTVINADSNWYIARVLIGSQIRLLTIDISTGSILTNVGLSGTYVGFEYNESNDSIYCLYHDGNTNYNLARIDPATGSTYTYPAISGVQAYIGETFALDVNDGYYSFRAATSSGYRLLTIDISNGSIAYDNPLTVNFTGHEYHCGNDSIYGLLQNTSTQDYYLMSMDNTTAQLTVIDTLPNVDGYASYTASLDVWNNTYSFYGFDGSNTKLIHLDASSGAVLSSSNLTYNAHGWEGYETCSPPPPPVADFESNQQIIVVGDSVDFTDLSLFSPNQWAWTFSGANPTTSSTQHPSDIVYNASGCFDVTLIASNGQGSDTITKPCYITVVEAPEADFVADTVLVAVGDSVHFTDLSTNNPTAWNWNIVQGTPPAAVTQNPAVQYNVPGNYDVTLIASNQAGSDTLTKVEYIHVFDLPAADFTADDTVVNEGDTVFFTDQSTGNITSWQWTFSGGTPNATTQSVPGGIVYNTAGCYDVTLFVSNPLGSDALTRTCYIEVLPDPVESAFVGDSLVIASGENVDFTDLSSNNPTSWNWTFQGGMPGASTAQHPLDVVYDTPGCYDVTLHAQNASGGDTAFSACYITVTEPDTPAGISAPLNLQLRMYPNPARDHVKLSWGLSVPLHWQLIDTKGCVVRQGKATPGTVLSLEGIVPGYYTVRYDSSRGLYHAPLIIAY